MVKNTFKYLLPIRKYYEVLELSSCPNQPRNSSLRKTCQNAGFLWSVFSHKRTELKILSLQGKIQVSKNLHSGVYYVALTEWDWSTVTLTVAFSQFHPWSPDCSHKIDDVPFCNCSWTLSFPIFVPNIWYQNIMKRPLFGGNNLLFKNACMLGCAGLDPSA